MSATARLLLALLVLAGMGPPAGAADDAPTLATEHLAVRLSPEAGAVELRVLDAGEVVHTAVAPALLLDGERQTGFAAGGSATARNGALDVALEVLGPRAVAVTWTARDGGVHAFELHLASDDETAYYGTGERNALFATFTPFMQVHGTANLGPWDFDAETLAVFRRYAVLRTRLFPYLYEAVREAAATGLPPIRPMALAFPGDPEAADQIYQYLFGPDLLVAPIYQPGTHRSVYLPAGEWVDHRTRRRLRGPRTLEVEAPLAEIPLFVRAGAILPLLPDDVETLVRRRPGLADDVVALDDRRVLEVWPGEAGRLATRDGLSAELMSRGGRTTLRLAAREPLPLEVHLLGRRLPELAVAGAEVRVDERGDTRVRFPSFAGELALQW